MEPGPLGSPLASGFLSAVCSRSSCSYRRLCSELQLGDLAHDVMGIDSVTETFFVEKPKPPVTQIPVALTRSFPTCNMINSQHHKLSPEKMFVLKGVIVTENDLGLEKMGEIFLYWRNDFWETPDFYIYVTINCKCYVFFWFLHDF